MNIYQEIAEGAVAIDLDVAAAELKATSLIQNEGVRRARMAGPSIDVLVAYVGETLRALAGGGADLSKTIAITIGSDHPSFLAGQTVIEAKAAAARPVTPPADDCDGCPVDHSDAGERDE